MTPGAAVKTGELAVTIVLSPALEVPTVRDAAVAGLAADLGVFMEELGLSARPAVDVATAASGRVLRVVVEGRVRPYSRRLLQRSWRAVAPPELQHLMDPLAPSGGRFPDQWVDTVAEQPSLAGELLRTLAMEAIKARPGCLLTLQESGLRADRMGVPVDYVTATLGQLLDLGVSLRHGAVVEETIAASYRLGVPPADALEALVDRLRAPSIEARLAPEYADLPATDGPDGVRTFGDELTSTFPMIDSGILVELGVRCPGLALIRDPAMPAGRMGVRINDVLSWLPVLAAGELLVGESPNRLAERGMQGRPFPNPATREPCAVVSEETRPELDRLRLPYWTASGFLTLAVYAEIKRLADRIVAAGEVETRLALLAASAPALVHELLRRASVFEVASVIRALAREGVPCGDLTVLAERLIDLDTVEVEAGMVALDDRLPLRPGSIHDAAWQRLAWARIGLGRWMADRYAYSGRMVLALRLAGATEERAAADGAGAFTDSDREALLAGLWAGRAGPAGGPATEKAVVLTGVHARAAIRRLTEDEMPEIPVVAVEELPPDVRVHFMGEEEEAMSTEVATTTERVRQFLVQLVGPALTVEEDGQLHFPFETTRVFVSIWGQGERTLVTVEAPMNHAVPPTPELFHWVATHGDDWIYGHLGAGEEDDGVAIRFRHSLLGTYLDFDELADAVRGVARTAVDTADEIQAKFGGKRFSEE